MSPPATVRWSAWEKLSFSSDVLGLASVGRKISSISHRMIPLLLRPAHESSAYRNRHRDQGHVAQFTFHAIAAGSASHCLEYGLVHSNASLEIFQWKIFIRRMRPAILQRETDQQRFDAKNISKVGDDWNAPAFANEGRVLVEHFLQRSLRGLAEFTVRVGQ